MRRTAATPSVTGVALVSHLPLSPVALNTDCIVDGQPAASSAEQQSARLTATTPQLFRVLDVPLLGGGCVSALAGGLFLRTLLFDIAPWDPVTLACVSLFLLSLAMTASYLRARRADCIDPAVALRPH